VSPQRWAVWSFDARTKTWLEVDSGPERAMRASLETRQKAAAKHLPDARFQLSLKSTPPVLPPALPFSDSFRWQAVGHRLEQAGFTLTRAPDGEPFPLSLEGWEALLEHWGPRAVAS